MKTTETTPRHSDQRHGSVHELKTWTKYFEAVLSGQKTFEVRKDDRGFKVGDTLLLREWKSWGQKYTGRSLSVRVTYITTFGQPCGQVVMAIASNDQVQQPHGREKTQPKE